MDGRFSDDLAFLATLATEEPADDVRDLANGHLQSYTPNRVSGDGTRHGPVEANDLFSPSQRKTLHRRGSQTDVRFAGSHTPPAARKRGASRGSAKTPATAVVQRTPSSARTRRRRGRSPGTPPGPTVDAKVTVGTPGRVRNAEERDHYAAVDEFVGVGVVELFDALADRGHEPTPSKGSPARQRPPGSGGRRAMAPTSQQRKTRRTRGVASGDRVARFGDAFLTDFADLLSDLVGRLVDEFPNDAIVVMKFVAYDVVAHAAAQWRGYGMRPLALVVREACREVGLSAGEVHHVLDSVHDPAFRSLAEDTLIGDSVRSPGKASPFRLSAGSPSRGRATEARLRESQALEEEADVLLARLLDGLGGDSGSDLAALADGLFRSRTGGAAPDPSFNTGTSVSLAHYSGARALPPPRSRRR